ncbi:MAG: LLM class F420-dependent oxidoreductase [SAR202 cluster bacterium]|jgi:probable F420-dependent oxidoreductase|nr:LLM class F420-dependent oxidoreductase [Dehalococcoidia bacterium]MQG54849.1 LLM class F420-dependent oxidoreductase [SAR202 cluster bacterium]
MNIGTSVPLPAYTIDPAFMAKKAEDLGFESIWYAEHAAVPVHSDSPFPATGGEIPWTYSHFTDPYIALARASGATSKILLGTGITLVPERNPILLAKEIASLDRFSGGRFLFGIGTGWLKEETEMMGGDFEHRWTQTREAIEVMKELWTKEEAEYHGRYFDFPLVKSYPKPFQKPHPPVILGGMAKNVLRRVVTHADGWLPNRVTPAEVEESRKKLDAMAAEAGRDPKSITISVYGQLPERDIVHSLLTAGADRVVVRPEHVETEKEMGDQLERMAEAVLR